MHPHIDLPDDVGPRLGAVVDFALAEFDACGRVWPRVPGGADEVRSARARTCYLRGEDEIRSAMSSGRIDCIDQAIAHFTEGVAARSAETAVVLSGLADALRRRFEFSGATDELGLAVAVSRRLLDTVTTSAPFDRDALNVACATVGDAFWASDAAVDEVDRAIDVAGDLVVAGRDDVGPYRYLVTAAGLAGARFSRDGTLSDVRRSVTLLEEAARADVEDSDSRTIIRANLADHLLELSAADSDPALVRRARDVYQEASREVAAQEHPYLRARILLGQTEALSRFDGSPGSPSVADLEEAVVLGEQAVSVANPDGTGIDRARVALAGSLVSLHLLTGESHLLDQAVTLFVEALDHTDPGSPNQVAYRCGLADAYMFRARGTGASLDERIATAAYRAVWRPEVPAGVLIDRIRSALTWGEWALRRGDDQEACEALGRGYAEIHHLVGRQARRGDKVSWIRLCRRIPVLLALALVRLGNPRDAVAVVDGGRALLLADAMRGTGGTS